jgi:hypothetical protein
MKSRLRIQLVEQCPRFLKVGVAKPSVNQP